MKTVKANDGQPIYLCDINHVAPNPNISRDYLYGGIGTPINAKLIFDSLPNVAGNINNLMNFAMGSYVPDDSGWNDLVNNFYYFIGGINRDTEQPSSGIAFTKDSSLSRLYMVAFTNKLTENWNNRGGFATIEPTVGIGSGSNADNIIYLVDLTYINGSLEDTFTNGKGMWYLTAPYNIERVSIGADDTPLYDITAEQTLDNVLSYTGSDLYNGIIRRCPNLANYSASYYYGDYIPFWLNNEVEHDSQDDGGYSETGGGDGTPQESIDIDFPELPPSILLASGIVKMFRPNVTQMNNFVNYIYSAPEQIITNFKKLWVNPMDSIISLALSPIAVPTGNNEEIKFCGVGSGVVAPVITEQYMKIDCGTLKLNEEYNTLLDYSNYTQVKCFLPFFGFVDLNADEVMNAEIHIEYNVDLLTGEALAVIKCTKFKQIGKVKIDYNSCLYQFKGNLLSQVPLTGNNYQQLYSGVINLVTAVALPNPVSVAGVANDLLGQKVTTQHGGSLTGNGGALGEYIPYLIVTKPIRHLPENFQSRLGYPSDLGQFTFEQYKGYLEVDRDSLKFNDIPYITSDEMEELKNILESGVII